MPVVFQIAVISVNFFISIIIQRRASFAPIIDKHYSYCLTYNHNGYFLIKSPVFTPVFHIASNSDIAPWDFCTNVPLFQWEPFHKKMPKTKGKPSISTLLMDESWFIKILLSIPTQCYGWCVILLRAGRLNMQTTEYHYLRLNMANVRSLGFLWKYMTFTVTIKCHQAKVVRWYGGIWKSDISLKSRSCDYPCNVWNHNQRISELTAIRWF